MSNNQRYFRGALQVRSGQYEHETSYLLAATTQKRAWAVLEQVAANFYGDDAPMEDGGYFFNHGELFVRTSGVREIGLAEFEALRGHLHVRSDDNVSAEEVAPVDVMEGFKAFAKSAANLLQKRQGKVSHSVMLEVLAGALGQKNWQVLANKFASADATPAPVASSTSKSLVQLRQEALEEIGFSFSPDSDQPGLWVWQAVTDGCDVSFDSLETAVYDAWSAAAGQAREAFHLTELQWSVLSFIRQRELLLKLGGQDGEGESTYEVDVCRIGYGFATIRVQAHSKEAARELALEEAGDHSYSEKTADYEVDAVRKV